MNKDDTKSEVETMRKLVADVTIQNAYMQANETSPLYECANPGCADPVDNDAPDQFVSQIAMVIKYSEKYPSIGLRATSSTSLTGYMHTQFGIVGCLGGLYPPKHPHFLVQLRNF